MIDNLGPPWKVGKCEGCGTEIETMPGERYVGSIDGRLWHLGCSPRTIEAQPRSPVEDALGAFLVWADRVQADGGDHYLNGEKPPFGNGDDAWDDLDALRDGAREALSQSPAIDPRVEELVEAARGRRLKITITPEMIRAGARELVFDCELIRADVAEDILRAALEAGGYEIVEPKVCGQKRP